MYVASQINVISTGMVRGKTAKGKFDKTACLQLVAWKIFIHLTLN